MKKELLWSVSSIFYFNANKQLETLAQGIELYANISLKAVNKIL